MVDVEAEFILSSDDTVEYIVEHIGTHVVEHIPSNARLLYDIKECNVGLSFKINF